MTIPIFIFLKKNNIFYHLMPAHFVIYTLLNGHLNAIRIWFKKNNHYKFT